MNKSLYCCFSVFIVLNFTIMKHKCSMNLPVLDKINVTLLNKINLPVLDQLTSLYLINCSLLKKAVCTVVQ